MANHTNNSLVESFSGIRGVYGASISEETVFKYTYSYVNLLMKKRRKTALNIAIGTDTRPSSPEIKKIMIDVLTLMRCKVIDLGYCTTPAVELAVREYKADGGIIVTASHNEPHFNGWKLLDRDGGVLRASDAEAVIKKVRSIDESKLNYKDFKRSSPRRQSYRVQNKHTDIVERYVKFVLRFLDKDDLVRIKRARIKLVVDPVGGPASLIIKKLFTRLGIKFIGANMKLGDFRRKIEPNEESLRGLVMVTKKTRSNFGCGFDLDADRVEVIVKKKVNGSNIIPGDYVLGLVVDEILNSTRSKKRTVVVNDATSAVVREIARKNKARVFEVEAGETNIVTEMRKLKSQVGGESTGCVIPPSRCRDGILTVVMLVRMMVKRRKKIDQILQSYPVYYTLKKAVDCGKKEMNAVRKGIEEYFRKRKARISRKGGKTGSIKIAMKKSSFLWFRQSKTEPGIFRIIADSDSRAEAKKNIALGEKIVDTALKKA